MGEFFPGFVSMEMTAVLNFRALAKQGTYNFKTGLYFKRSEKLHTRRRHK